uniref:Zinc finger protein 830like [Nasonia vitripennis] n=1 Tax=Lepeophtheirus salmonis TaxID=72036 RepID=A0A0K2V566_LEPSM|nr:LOW QUALITY PROTEIN: zinc finger protein 830-like [Lepeophtheirus salmonis]
MSEKNKSVDQAALSRLMAEAKASKKRPGINSHDRKLKKYKISKKEELLIEEAKSKSLTIKSSLPQGFFDAKPAKSILKNSQSYVPPVQPYLIYNPPSAKGEGDKKDSSVSKTEEYAEDETPTGELPKGFFDDPIKDAKARQVEYRDPVQAEWEKFQKEISVEINTASEIAADDQVEATTDRQLEEIEEQMSAWNRVMKMEKERDQVEGVLKEKHDNNDELMEQGSSNSDDDEDVDIDEFLNWRNKC